jgi:transposase InsO family protein
MAWRNMEVQDQRFRFVVAASQQGANLSRLCAEFEISRPTGYLWRARYGWGGLAGMSERSRRPRLSPRRTEERIEQRIVALRAERPDWGARKLAVLLGREGIEVPPATVHRVLLRRGLVRLDDRRRQAPGRFQREQPNQLWQMDFKSPKGWDQPVGPLSVLDDRSRYAVALASTGTTRAEAVRERLQTAFSDCDLPDAMLMDHGIPWWNMSSPGGWTQLSVWLMKQGIRLLYSGVRHPQTQGKVERFHGALEMARRRRGLPDPEMRQRWLDDFRHEYNHLRPHQALNMQTPASVWHPSPRRYDSNPPPWEYPPDAEVVRLESHGRLTLNGRRWQVASPLAGEPVQIIRLHQRVLILYCNTVLRELNLAAEASTSVEPPAANPTL